MQITGNRPIYQPTSTKNTTRMLQKNTTRMLQKNTTRMLQKNTARMLQESLYTLMLQENPYALIMPPQMDLYALDLRIDTVAKARLISLCTQ